MLILASSSPQRHQLLTQCAVPFSSRDCDYKEDHHKSQQEKLVQEICHSKLEQFLEIHESSIKNDDYVLTADTMVFIDHHRLGKPKDRDEARNFLKILSGSSHEVVSGYCLYCVKNKDLLYRESSSLVSFFPLCPQDLDWYLDSNEWQGAAGAYRIQNRGACFIKEIKGSWTGIMGLPLELLYGDLKTRNLLK